MRPPRGAATDTSEKVEEDVVVEEVEALAGQEDGIWAKEEF